MNFYFLHVLWFICLSEVSLSGEGQDGVSGGGGTLDGNGLKSKGREPPPGGGPGDRKLVIFGKKLMFLTRKWPKMVKNALFFAKNNDFWGHF